MVFSRGGVLFNDPDFFEEVSLLIPEFGASEVNLRFCVMVGLDVFSDVQLLLSG